MKNIKFVSCPDQTFTLLTCCLLCCSIALLVYHTAFRICRDLQNANTTANFDQEYCYLASEEVKKEQSTFSNKAELDPTCDSVAFLDPSE